ncbi:LysR family transcriptional regulator [Glycomyces arizonensis]|uniref:LysR family transcriptional regulator n=1 Tax=Glycomyces arizonensis TaxID=256035 RepID=UPI00047AC367|nr:LysR family transcriptional regulator [Glycomyces arizonensis]
MHLDLLRSFMAVYRTGSFSRSAVHLGLSQPGVTAQIQNLERRLGFPLFDRTSQGAVPLPRAHALAKDVAAHLDSLETLWGRHVDELEPTEPTVYIGGPAELLGVAVIPALSECLAAGIRVHAVHGLPDGLLKGLGAGEYDLVVSTTKPGRDDLRGTPLFDERFVLVAPPDYGPLADLSERDRAAGDFPPDCRMIAYAPDLPVVRRYWRTAYGRMPDMTGALIVPDLRSVLNAVKAGLGISVLPTYLCAAELDRREIEVVHRPESTPFNTIYLVERRSSSADSAVGRVRSAVVEAARAW